MKFAFVSVLALFLGGSAALAEPAMTYITVYPAAPPTTSIRQECRLGSGGVHRCYLVETRCTYGYSGRRWCNRHVVPDTERFVGGYGYYAPPPRFLFSPCCRVHVIHLRHWH